MPDHNQSSFKDCCNAVGLGSGRGEEFGQTQEDKKYTSSMANRANGTQTATATKGANFRKYPFSKTPQTRALILRRVPRMLFKSTCFLEVFLEGACKVVRSVLRRERFIKGA